MDRNAAWQQLTTVEEWDILIIGGGATGLACAVDAASRGLRTLLLEKSDFAKGTSSRATKLVHGGVRYLAQGNIRLVKEALAERGWLLRQAPHVCHPLVFVIPVYKWWQKWYYGFGLWLYETLSFHRSLGPTRLLSRAATIAALPGITPEGLYGGVQYYDGQFDDARLAINLAQTAVEQGAAVLNHVAVTGFLHTDTKVTAVKVHDAITGANAVCRAKVIINATGVFADTILQQAERHAQQTITPSQGVHIVVDAGFLPGQQALMIPKTTDGRVLFAIPWRRQLLIGTTDTPVPIIEEEPRALPEEIDFILNNINRYTTTAITYTDIRTMFAGLRPLAAAGQGETKKTAVMPRDHHVERLSSGLIHITGGKWTTCRRMAEDAITVAVTALAGKAGPCITSGLRVHGYSTAAAGSHLDIYGSDAQHILQLLRDNPRLSALIHPSYPFTLAELHWAVREEMALTVEDVLARRIRLLFTDAKAAIETAPVAAREMAILLGRDEEWVSTQVNSFTALAHNYLPLADKLNEH